MKSKASLILSIILGGIVAVLVIVLFVLFAVAKTGHTGTTMAGPSKTLAIVAVVFSIGATIVFARYYNSKQPSKIKRIFVPILLGLIPCCCMGLAAYFGGEFEGRRVADIPTTALQIIGLGYFFGGSLPLFASMGISPKTYGTGKDIQ